jgi:hypothetical protein
LYWTKIRNSSPTAMRSPASACELLTLIAIGTLSSYSFVAGAHGRCAGTDSLPIKRRRGRV